MGYIVPYLEEIKQKTQVVAVYADMESILPANAPLSNYSSLTGAVFFAKGDAMEHIAHDAQEEVLEIVLRYVVNEQRPLDWVKIEDLLTLWKKFLLVQRRKNQNE